MSKVRNSSNPPTAPAGFSFIKAAGGIEEYQLQRNGLRVLLLRDNSAPVVAVQVTYHVGSRNEATGHTGATHLLEHLMFKGSKKFNRAKGNSIERLMDARGAKLNATTWFDRTNYYEVLPSEYVGDALAIEADRMRFAYIRERDRASEMTVVRNEYERGENEPFQVLNREIWATAFQAHPYHHDTIGWRSDIENVPIARLKQFYNTFYYPNNATLSLVGDFEPLRALELIEKEFGHLSPATHAIPEVYTKEPPQEGERRVVVGRRGTRRVIGVGHKIPEGLHPDFPALFVLATILAGGKLSRLYRELVDSNRALDVFPFVFPLRDPGLFVIYAVLLRESERTLVEERMTKVYADVARRGVTEAELSRSKAQILAQDAFQKDGAYNIAAALNEAISLGDWTSYVEFSRRISAVTRDDVRRVAGAYFHDDAKTVGHYIPKKSRTKSRGKTPSPRKQRP